MSTAPVTSVTEASDAGTDLVNSSITYTLGSNVENLTLTGSANINGTGNSLANTLTGNSGNNVSWTARPAPTRWKAAQATTPTMSTTPGTPWSRRAARGQTWSTARSATSSANNVENLTLTGSANINGYGNGLANTLTGNAGNNALNGLAGADTMAGGAGNDTYYVDNAGDTVVEASGAGTDLVNSSIALRPRQQRREPDPDRLRQHQRLRQRPRQHPDRQRGQQRS